MELPPYWQDLCDVGKLESAGWLFFGSLNSERATGGIEDGNPPFEVGVSQNDMDFLHVVNWERAAEVAQAGNTETYNGMPYITLDTAVAENLVHLVPEHKSPHGSDVTPDGKYVIVSGKLDPTVTGHAVADIVAAIESGAGETDDYGLRILPFEDVMFAQIEVGLRPLHTQFDGDGNAYTSLFLDNAVAKWTYGDDPSDSVLRRPRRRSTTWATSPRPRATPCRRTASTSSRSTSGRPTASTWWARCCHRTCSSSTSAARRCRSSTTWRWAWASRTTRRSSTPTGCRREVYPEIGWDPHTGAVDPNATLPGQERVERNGNNVEIWITAIRSHFTPENIDIRKGDQVVWHITNVERAYDATHGFALPGHNVNLSIEPGEPATVEFDANNSGVFNFYCTEFCSALHLEMMGHLLVR